MPKERDRLTENLNFSRLSKHPGIQRYFCRIRREHLKQACFRPEFPLAGGESGGTKSHKGNIDIFAFGQLFPAVGFQNKSDFTEEFPENSKGYGHPPSWKRQ